MGRKGKDPNGKGEAVKMQKARTATVAEVKVLERPRRN